MYKVRGEEKDRMKEVKGKGEEERKNEMKRKEEEKKKRELEEYLENNPDSQQRTSDGNDTKKSIDMLLKRRYYLRWCADWAVLPQTMCLTLLPWRRRGLQLAERTTWQLHR